MPDITMCEGTGCKVKDKCYRHTAEPHPYRQSWFMNVPGKDKTCEYYWEAISKSQLRRLNVQTKKK